MKTTGTIEIKDRLGPGKSLISEILGITFGPLPVWANRSKAGTRRHSNNFDEVYVTRDQDKYSPYFYESAAAGSMLEKIVIKLLGKNGSTTVSTLQYTIERVMISSVVLKADKKEQLGFNFGSIKTELHHS